MPAQKGFNLSMNETIAVLKVSHQFIYGNFLAGLLTALLGQLPNHLSTHWSCWLKWTMVIAFWITSNVFSSARASSFDAVLPRAHTPLSVSCNCAVTTASHFTSVLIQWWTAVALWSCDRIMIDTGGSLLSGPSWILGRTGFIYSLSLEIGAFLKN